MDRDQLMASLLAGSDDIDGVTFEDDRYFDWSSTTDDGVSFEVGHHSNGSNAAQLDLSWSEMERLQRALTLRLLRRG